MKQLVVALLLGACGAQQVKIDPVKFEPIHITVDVNLRNDTSPTGTPAKR